MLVFLINMYSSNYGAASKLTKKKQFWWSVYEHTGGTLSK